MMRRNSVLLFFFTVGLLASVGPSLAEGSNGFYIDARDGKVVISSNDVDNMDSCSRGQRMVVYDFSCAHPLKPGERCKEMSFISGCLPKKDSSN